MSDFLTPLATSSIFIALGALYLCFQLLNLNLATFTTLLEPGQHHLFSRSLQYAHNGNKLFLLLFLKELGRQAVLLKYRLKLNSLFKNLQCLPLTLGIKTRVLLRGPAIWPSLLLSASHILDFLQFLRHISVFLPQGLSINISFYLECLFPNTHLA